VKLQQNDPTNGFTMRIKTIVANVMSYDVLIGGAILYLMGFTNAPLSSLMKTMEGKGVGVRCLSCSTSRVEGHVRAPKWGLGRFTSKSITDTDLHKPNNQLVNAQFEHL
jgi:hypothetical protein